MRPSGSVGLLMAALTLISCDLELEQEAIASRGIAAQPDPLTPSVNTILFTTGTTHIDALSDGVLREWATFLDQHPEERATLTAYTGQRCDPNYDLAAACGLGDAVKWRLMELGIESDRIDISTNQTESSAGPRDEETLAASQWRVEITLADTVR